MSGFFGVRAPVMLLTAQSVGSGTTYTIDNTVIARPFVKLELYCASLSHNDVGSQAFRIEISGDNGSNWSTAHAFSSAVAASATISTCINVLNAAVTGSATRMIQTWAYSQNAGTNIIGLVSPYTVAGPINAIRLSPAASSFDGGTVTLIGYPV